MNLDLSRRRFVQLLSGFSAAGNLRRRAQTKAAPRPSSSLVTKNRKNLVATQVKAYGWQDQAIDELLDNLQQKGNINTAFAFTFLSDPHTPTDIFPSLSTHVVEASSQATTDLQRESGV